MTTIYKQSKKTHQEKEMTDQYIITEDDLVVWEDDLDAIDGEWGVGRGRGTDEHTNKQVSIINRVRSHLYQSERETILSKFADLIHNESVRLPPAMVDMVYSYRVAQIIKELRLNKEGKG